VDIIIPVTYWDTVLCRENITAIIIQVKNDKSYQVKVDRLLFDTMDPYQTKFFDENKKDPLPMIQMVFALASTEPCITVVLELGERVQLTREKAPKSKFHANRYTSFDIWCAMASRVTFQPICSNEVFAKLLLQSQVFPNVYLDKKTDKIQNITRSMNPGRDIPGAHWTQFVDGV
jgi:hypothetical protein